MSFSNLPQTFKKPGTLTAFVKKISISELNKEHLLVEVLSEESYNLGHIPRAINIPTEDIKELAPRMLKDKNKSVVLYSAGSHCSLCIKAAEMLEQLGYTNISVFSGGKQEWARNRKDFVKTR